LADCRFPWQAFRKARNLRLEYPAAIYHVMNRCDRCEAIFTDDADRQRFLDWPGEACAKTQWQVHAFCLLPNHLLLVMQTPMRDRQQFKGVVKVDNRFCVAPVLLF